MKSISEAIFEEDIRWGKATDERTGLRAFFDCGALTGLVKANKMKVAAAYYDIGPGTVSLLE